jgi:hypothetical protein
LKETPKRPQTYERNKNSRPKSLKSKLYRKNKKNKRKYWTPSKKNWTKRESARKDKRKKKLKFIKIRGAKRPSLLNHERQNQSLLSHKLSHARRKPADKF